MMMCTDLLKAMLVTMEHFQLPVGWCKRSHIPYTNCIYVCPYVCMQGGVCVRVRE